MIITITVLLLFSTEILAENKLSDVLKNQTSSLNNSTKNPNEENFLKEETHKLLKECGAEDNDSNEKNTKPRRSSNNNFNPRRRYESNESYERGKNTNKRYKNENYSNESGESEEQRHNNNRNPSNNKRYRPDDCYNDQFRPYDSRDSGHRDYTHNSKMDRRVNVPGYNRNFDSRFRRKRAEDDQCVSQCVFGFLEVLDDSGSPSETRVIKWLQDHIQNDLKKMRAFRTARRCFAQLSTNSDLEGGCEFSKALQKCLNLELE